MIPDLLIPFLTIGLAELGDKTQLSILLLSSKTKKHLELLLGVMTAFLITDGIAILIGSWITSVVPMAWIKIVSGVIFIVFGILTLKDTDEEGRDKLYSSNAFIAGFVMIFLTEWGDKTQIAAALFATKYHPLLVLISTLAALAVLSVMAVYLGKFIAEKIDKKIISRIAGILFILIGASFFLFLLKRS
ncbi:MAG: TMEM165/GDT1 family protein [Proteobacteria bacterium]|nr:TMEM165/GDT1 family protein [Pseudomonadota bacterium]